MQTNLKIAILDGFVINPGDLSWDELAELGELKIYERTAPGDILARMEGCQAVFTNKCRLTAEIIDRCPQLKFIGVLATGYNVVDIQAADRRGIPVCNIPTYGTTAVAQMTMALLLEICHNAQEHSQAVKAGEWASCPDWCFWKFPLIELAGKTMGIIGFGRIGQAVGKLAKAFGMEVLANDAHETESGRAIGTYVTREELLARADIISLHCPLFPDTEGIIGRENLAKMKDGVIILNTSRGPLVDEAALAEALKSGKVYAAGVDVVSTEPIRPDNPLLSCENCLITPHISWAPAASRKRLMDIAVENLKAFVKGEPVNVVNLKQK